MNHIGKSSIRLWSYRGSGFTLVELTFCILLIGIIATVATPKYFASLDRYRVEMAVKRLANDIRLAQNSARQTNFTQTIRFTRADSTYSIDAIKSIERPSASYTVLLTDSPYQVRMVGLIDSTQPTASPATITVTFNRFGIPDRGVTIILQSGSRSQQVQVDASSGKVKIQ